MFTRCIHARNTPEQRRALWYVVQNSLSTCTFAARSLDMRSKHARCALGVRYISADEHTTNTERVLRVYPALVQRSPRMSGVLLTCTFMRRIPRTILCMHKIPDAPSEWPRMKIVGPARSTNDDEQRRTTHFSVRFSCVLHACTRCDWALTMAAFRRTDTFNVSGFHISTVY